MACLDKNKGAGVSATPYGGQSRAVGRGNSGLMGQGNRLTNHSPAYNQIRQGIAQNSTYGPMAPPKLMQPNLVPPPAYGPNDISRNMGPIPTSYNLDPRQAQQFAALPPEMQEKYYQGGMNRPSPQPPMRQLGIPAQPVPQGRAPQSLPPGYADRFDYWDRKGGMNGPRQVR